MDALDDRLPADAEEFAEFGGVEDVASNGAPP
jgi:hypothetical protein